MNRKETIQSFENFLRKYEKAYAGKIRKALNEQVMVELQTGKSNMAGLYKVIEQLYMSAFVTYGKRMNIFIKREEKKRDGSMGFSEILARKFKEQFGVSILNTSQGITETTKELIRRLLSEFVEEGFNIRELAKKMEGVNANRALLIARTEVTGAANAGAYFTASQSRLVMQKEWLATNDKRTRKTHKHSTGISGTTIELNELFTVGKYKMLHPGDKGGRDGRLPVGAEEVCNCRCTLLFKPKRDEKGRLILKK